MPLTNISTKTAYSLTLLSFIIIGFAVYANSLNVPFYFDDYDNIKNPALMLEEFSPEALLNALSQGTSKQRPIANLSFALNYYLNEYDPTGYHVLNIIFHIVTGFALFIFLHLTLTLPVNSSKYRKPLLLAYLVSLLWLVHPLGTQSVTYLVQRMNSMAVMFYLLSMIFYIIARRIQQSGERETSGTPVFGCFILSFLLGLLALGSKENAATLPVMILCYELYFFRDLKLKINTRTLFWFSLICLTLIGLMYFYLGNNPWRIFSSTCTGRDFTVYERLLTQGRVIMHYLSLIIYPHPSRLVLDYNFPVSTSLFQPMTTLYSLILIAGLLVLTLVTAKKEKLLSFCLLAFFLSLVIESSIICLEIIYEHRTYMPSMFILLLLTALLSRTGKISRPLPLLLLSMALVFGYWTIQRNSTWQNEIAFWSDNVRKSPGKPRSLCNLGNAYFDNNNFKQAIQYYTEAIALLPEFGLALGNLGLAYFKLGNYDEAEKSFTRALAVEPTLLKSRFYLAVINYKKGLINEAIEEMLALHRITPDAWKLNKTIGQIMLRTGKPKEALSYLETAARFRSEDSEILMLEGEAQLRLHMRDRAKETFKKVLSLDQSSAGAHYNLARLLSPKSELDEVLYHYRAAVDYNPFYMPALYNLANLLFKLGQNNEAELLYRRIIEMTPEVAGAYNNLGLILVRSGETKQAVKFFQAAARINPDDSQARSNLEMVESVLRSEQADNLLLQR